MVRTGRWTDGSDGSGGATYVPCEPVSCPCRRPSLAIATSVGWLNAARDLEAVERMIVVVGRHDLSRVPYRAFCPDPAAFAARSNLATVPIAAPTTSPVRLSMTSAL